VGESCNPCIKKEIWVGYWVVHAILASSHKLSFGFVGKSCNTYIKEIKIDWFMGGWCNMTIAFKIK